MGSAKAAVWDVVAWIVALAVAVVVYYRLQLADLQWLPLIDYLAVACVLQVAIGFGLKLYRGGFRAGSFDETSNVGLVWLIVSILAGAFHLAVSRTLWQDVDQPFPTALGLVTPLSVPLFMLAPRWIARSAERLRADSDASAASALIYGAGEAGAQVARLLLIETDAPFRAVGFIDDDPQKRHLRIEGLRVLGTGDALARIVQERGVRTVIVAITAAAPSLITRIEAAVEGLGVTVRVVPPAREILGAIGVGDMRRVDVTDVLGRRQITTNIDQVSTYLRGKRVLVTGGGGSIGSELVRQVRRFGPAELIVLDRDEGGLHATQLSVYGQALLDTPDMVLVSIRDAEALDAVFARHRPEVVFHAAALKHLPLLEQYPDEGWKTNVLGTANVLESADRHGVETFVNISTDKAAEPISVLGRTKRCAEHLTSWYGHYRSGRYISVRFGNVLGSRGSVLVTFARQVEQGGPVTVTHPEVRRFFMTIAEACELVIQAGAIGSDGEALVLDMGEPVRISDVARELIARSGRQIAIVWTGLRPGEKLDEVLFDHGEEVRSRNHPLIAHVSVPPVSPERIDAAYRSLGGTVPALPGTVRPTR